MKGKVTMIEFILGLFVGCFCGILLMALFSIAGEDDTGDANK